MYRELSDAKDVYVTQPIGYLENLRLVRDASMVLTDSGGLQKESFVLGTKVVTLREATEWTETVESGWNMLSGTDSRNVTRTIRKSFESRPHPVDAVALFGNGTASKRVARVVKAYLEGGTGPTKRHETPRALS